MRNVSCYGRWPSHKIERIESEVQVAIVAHGIGRKGRVHLRGLTTGNTLVVGRLIEHFFLRIRC